jgi:chromosome segregation ATPase
MSEKDSLPRRRKNDDTPPSGTVSSDAGILSMEERLEYLRAELSKWTTAQERYPARADDMNRRITELQAAIADTETRLAEYRTGRDGAN